MHDTAQRKFETAHSPAWRVLAVLGLALAAPGQTPAWADIDSLAVTALDAKDPLTRGEAALWLAESQSVGHYRAITSLARDPHPEARHRAIVALGRLAAPGADAYLAKLVLGEGDPQDTLLATFALGQLDHVTPAPAIDALLRRTQGASIKRNGDLLAALLGGLTAGGARGRAAALLTLRDSDATRVTAVRELAHAALVAAEVVDISRDQAHHWLDHSDPTFRRLALQHWQSKWPLAGTERDQVRRMARSDAEVDVRSAALELLARRLDATAIDLASRAVASNDPHEAESGARCLLRLVGVARAAAIEERALSDRTPQRVRLALIGTLAGGLQPRTLLTLHDLSADASAPDALRVAAALALARTESSFADAALRTVFRDLAAGRDLAEVARALLARGFLDAEVERLASDRDAVAQPRFAWQLHAIAVADAAAACSLTIRLSAAGRLREATLGAALGALRRARASRTAAIRAWLPPAVAALDL